MKQPSLDLNLGPTKRTRKRGFLEAMEALIPWALLIALIEPHYPKPSTKGGRPAIGLETMLRIHFLQQWFNLSDPAMEEHLHDVPLYREFARLDDIRARLPDETTILRFRHLLEKHGLAQQILATINALLTERGLLLREGTAVDATLIAAPSSTKNADGKRDPEMHSAKKGDNWHFGMKAHIGVDVESGLVHSVVGTAAHVSDISQAHALLHGDEKHGHGDAGFQGVDKRPEIPSHIQWHIAMRPGKRRRLDLSKPWNVLLERAEQIKARLRAKVEHPFRVLKCQFGHRKVRYRGLAKNTAQLMTLFALGNLWIAKGKLCPMG